VNNLEAKVTVTQGRLADVEEVSSLEIKMTRHKLQKAEDSLVAKERAMKTLREELLLMNSRMNEKELQISALKQNLDESRNKCVVVEGERDKVVHQHGPCDGVILELRRQLEKQTYTGVGMQVEEMLDSKGSKYMRVLKLNPDGGAFLTGLISVGHTLLSMDGVAPTSPQHVATLARGVVDSEVIMMMLNNQNGSEYRAVVKRKSFDASAKVGVEYAFMCKVETYDETVVQNTPVWCVILSLSFCVSASGRILTAFLRSQLCVII